MADPRGSPARDQLTDRRSKLERAIDLMPDDTNLLRLLDEVDAAICRLDNGTYGLCKACEEPIEAERLMADPLSQYCLAHLTTDQRHALEQDLELASKIQAALLPPKNLEITGWQTTYHYKGLEPVSGDFCDLLVSDGDLYFVVGDVSGKGIAASMLMAHLRATFRTLVALELPLEIVVERSSRMFCESTLPTHFATLVCGKARPSGEVTICNAGHHPPLLIRGAAIESIETRGLPLGVFCDERFELSDVRLRARDSLFLYTDGLVEALNASGEEYGGERLLDVVGRNGSLPPEGLISACIENLEDFRSGASMTDDLTIMVLRRR